MGKIIQIQEIGDHPRETIRVGVDSCEIKLLPFTHPSVRVLIHAFSKSFDGGQRRT